MNERAMISIDLMVAIVLILAAVLLATQIMPTVSHEDRDWRIKQYMTATRATDNLVQDMGEPGWEGKWRSNVTKIGLVYVDDKGKVMMKVLNLTKVNALMGDGYQDNVTKTIWWEFPNQSIQLTERENATKSLGMDGYNFYMQLHPVGLDLFNSSPLEINLSEQKGINYDTVTVVDRYVYIINPASEDQIKYLKFDNEAIHYRLNIWVW
jgi:hypothetical protein